MHSLIRLNLCALVLIVGVSVMHAADKEAGPKARRGGTLALYDTVEALKDADTIPSMVDEQKWVRIEGENTGAFKGDAVLLNDGLAVVVRADGSGADVYARRQSARMSDPDSVSAAWNRRGRLVPIAGQKALKLGPLKAVSNSETPIAVEAALEGGGGAIVLGLKQAHLPAVKATARGAVEGLRLHAPCRLGVLPDFFADDLMIDARKIPVPRTEIPSDNFFLHMIADGASILAALWDKNERDIEISLTGEGDSRVIASTDVFFGTGGSVWVAVLEEKGIWYSRNITREEGIKGGSLDWKVPYVAKWKGNFTRADGLIESRQFVYGHDSYIRGHVLGGKPGRLVAALNPVRGLGSEAVKKEYVGLDGVMVAYPITRHEETPLGRLCVEDLMRNCLGTEACAYVLDTVGKKPAEEGIFTCSYKATFKLMASPKPGYYRELAALYKRDRAWIRHLNEQVLIFVTHIQNRINQYVDFRKDLLAYLDEQEKKHPDHTEFISSLKKALNQKVRVFSRFRDPFERADGEERGRELLEEVYRATEIDTPLQAYKARQNAPLMSGIGDPQDAVVQGHRRNAKVLRAMATMEMATNPAAAEIAGEVRRRTEKVLRNPARYEKPTPW